jgi:hypothetical protein
MSIPASPTQHLYSPGSAFHLVSEAIAEEILVNIPLAGPASHSIMALSDTLRMTQNWNLIAGSHNWKNRRLRDSNFLEPE